MIDQLLICCTFKLIDRIMPPRKLTPAAVQQMINEGIAAALAGQAGAVPQDAGQAGAQAANGRNVCTYKDFMNCKPTAFKGTEGVVGLTQWFEKMESVFSRSSCPDDNKVKFATGTLAEHALSWWNAFAREKGIENAFSTSWEDFKKEMIKKYCSRVELKKMDNEFYGLVVKGVDIATYVRRFQELRVFCAHMVPDDEKLMEKFVDGLPTSIRGNVTAANVESLDDAIRMAEKLMDQVVKASAVQKSSNSDGKRRWEDFKRGNNNQYRGNAFQNQQVRRPETVKAFVATPAAGAGYAGQNAWCEKCQQHHAGPCVVRCRKCQKVGHIAKFCKGKAVATGANAQPVVTCFGCGERGHFRAHCPKNVVQGAGGARGRAYVMGNGERQQDPNVVTGTFLLNDFRVKVLFDSGADMSFVSSKISLWLRIAPTPLDACYSIELAKGM